MVRTSAMDDQSGTVSVLQLAFGLSALDCAIWERPDDVWRAMPQEQRDDYVAGARFVLGIAEDTECVPFGEIRFGEPSRPRVIPATGVVHARMSAGPSLAASEPHPVQLGDQRTVCTCGRWQFEDVPEPAKHISGCPVVLLTPSGPSS